MVFFVALILTLLSIAVLTWPFIRRERGAMPRISVLDVLQEALWREQQVFDEIKTLILDYDLGNVPHSEYEERLGDHRMRAAYALRERERLQQALAQLGEDVEDEVLTLRKSTGSVRVIALCEWCQGQIDTATPRCPRCGL